MSPTRDDSGVEQQTTAAVFVPERLSLAALRSAAAACTACELHRSGTQTVFGDGLKRSRLLLLGEQPGDREDREGRPFVGPAGRLLDTALVEAGIDRDDAYVTNTVKHFKWEARGKRRIHQKPNAEEIRACRPWLEAELAVVKPRVVVCLGATAAQALLGRSFRLTQHHGEFFELEGLPLVTATLHPSSVLRQRASADRERAHARLVEDLHAAVKRISNS